MSDVYDAPRQWCSLCKTAAHDECEPTDHSYDLRYQCMVCDKMIPEDQEICIEGWAAVHSACAESWYAEHSRSRCSDNAPDREVAS